MGIPRSEWYRNVRVFVFMKKSTWQFDNDSEIIFHQAMHIHYVVTRDTPNHVSTCGIGSLAMTSCRKGKKNSWVGFCGARALATYCQRQRPRHKFVPWKNLFPLNNLPFRLSNESSSAIQSSCRTYKSELELSPQPSFILRSFCRWLVVAYTVQFAVLKKLAKMPHRFWLWVISN